MNYQPDSGSTRRIQDRGFNLNSIFLSVLLAISGWTLLKVVTLSEISATQTNATLDLRVRIAACETQLQANTIAIVRLQAISPRSP